jgi:putative nucleotidyltransferase with HDIG domain
VFLSHGERIQDARAFLEEIAGNPPGLPYDPTLLPKLFDASREGTHSSLEEITAGIEKSQDLAVRILASANSAFYALESEVTSLSRAVSVLGLKEVRNTALMAGADIWLRNAKLPAGFDAAGALHHQILAAELAKALAPALREADPALLIKPDEAYAAGLLHDIGKVFLALRRPQVWAAVEELRKTTPLSFAEAEDEYWSIDHALVGARVLHYWKLPLMLTDSISWHHAPQLAPSFAAEARLLCAADILAHEGLGPDGALPARAADLLPENIDRAALAAAAQAAADRAAAMIGLVG